HLFFFFFQAEDGIRDFHLAGVQTCALPIWAIGADFAVRRRLGDKIGADRPTRAGPVVDDELLTDRGGQPLRRNAPHRVGIATGRSEERRVGKECRWGWVGSW